MKAAGAKMMALILAVVLFASAAPLPPATVPQTAPQTAPAVRFVPVDVYVNMGDKALGAYQIEIAAKNAEVVGIEGGESPAFQNAPYYDPAALQGKRIVIAAFCTAENLPGGLTRVARLHLMVSGGAANELPEMTSKLIVATDARGQTLETKVELRAMQGAKP